MDSDSSSVAPNISISIDAMGGDLGAPAIIGGMAKIANETTDISFIVHGDETILAPLIHKTPVLLDRCDVRHTDKAVDMTDKPSQVMRRGKGTSMWNAIDSVKSREATVAVSCGNTGALMAVSMLRLRKAEGISRPAIAIYWPSDNPQGFNIMLDVGADIRADADDLLKYALMGVSYARNGQGLKNPRVGLLNVGTEEHKGRAELKEAYELIEAVADQNNFTFVGFVEGGDIPSDRVDIIVTDGFTGNVALKTGEGTASMIGARLRAAFKHSILSYVGALFAFTSLRRFRHEIDPRRANGGVFLGLNGTVIKSHGDADATSFAAAIHLAVKLSKADFSEKLAARVASAVRKSDTA